MLSIVCIKIVVSVAYLCVYKKISNRMKKSLMILEETREFIFFNLVRPVERDRPPHGEMKKIPCPLRDPSPAEIELAKTDADARKRVRIQRLRVKRRNEEIERLTVENADCVYGDVDAVDSHADAVDHGDVYDDLVDDDVNRYVRIPSWYLHVLCLDDPDLVFTIVV